LPVVILVMVAVLVAVVTGCGAHRYDGRLVAADSLMRNDPDSALALLENLPTASLTTDGDRAYHGLLLAQARYKAYVVATSDSDINRALSYYRDHSSEREKLTRAYIYKGAVMEELGHPDSAMYYYKSAEATAAPDDYFNLGYCKYRIGELFQAQISQDSIAILMLKDALHYFTLLNDTNYIIACYGVLGAVCGVNKPDSTEYYLSKAIKLSQQFDSTKQYTYKSKLAGFNLYYKKDYDCAKNISMDIMRNGANYCEESQFYYYAVLSYIYLGNIDSAKLIANIIPAPIDAVDSMMHYDVVAELAKAELEHEKYSNTLSKNMDLKTNYIYGLQGKKLISTEKEFRQLQAINNAQNRITNLNLILFIAFIATVFLLVLVFTMKTQIKNHQTRINEIYHQLDESLQHLEQEREKNKHNKTVSQLTAYRISALQELYYDIRVKAPTSGDNTKQIIPLSSLLKRMNERNELLKLELRDTFWEKIKLSVDGEYNGIGSFVERHYPDISDKEKKLFYLSCANISPQIIKLCLNYSNAKTVSNYKIKLVREGFGLNMSFEEFVRRYLTGEIS